MNETIKKAIIDLAEMCDKHNISLIGVVDDGKSLLSFSSMKELECSIEYSNIKKLINSEGNVERFLCKLSEEVRLESDLSSFSNSNPQVNTTKH